MLYEFWDVYQHGQIRDAARTAESAQVDARHTEARLQQEVLRLESKIDGLALVCQALIEILRDSGGVSESSIEAKIREIDDRDGRADGRITGKPSTCPNCSRSIHSRQRVCMYCSTPIETGMLAEKPLISGSTRPRGKPRSG